MYVFYTRKNKLNPIKLLFTSVWSSIERERERYIYIYFFFFPLSDPLLWSVVSLYRKKKFPSSLSHGYYCFYHKNCHNNRKSFHPCLWTQGTPSPKRCALLLDFLPCKSVCNVFSNGGLGYKGSEVLMVELGFYQRSW